MTNRLARATSPYLLQHADNPVDWWPWCPEAFEEARRRDLPVLLSVGYAACHWCHVMAHESFEHAATARLVNDHCVPVKVDREERPDIDAVYMSATQAMHGHGGWPMTVWCTPDAEPFFCGTYFPREAFAQLVVGAAGAWRDRRDDVLAQTTALGNALKPVARAASQTSDAALTPVESEAAVTTLRRDYDTVGGGFGGAPKFPPAMVGQFLLRYHSRTGDATALEMVNHTCEAMARGGLYDQLAGGFSRYTVDDTWTVPHFEKMLYDNALILNLYLTVMRTTGSPLAARVADETVEFLLTQLRTADGGFASSLDADTDGVEGATYVWTPEQLREVLGNTDTDGNDDATWVSQLLEVTPEGSFEHGASVLTLRRDPDDPRRWSRLRATLRAARADRPQPGRDDKLVTAWNALAITALAEHGELTGAAASTAAAVAAAQLLLERHWSDGVLARTSLNGAVGPAGVLEDYGCLADALCMLHQVTGEPGWLKHAGELLDAALAQFTDPAGGFFDTPTGGEQLFYRPKDITDTATPSGNSALITALISYTALTGRVEYRDRAIDALATYHRVLPRSPRFAGWAGSAAEALHGGPVQVAVVGAGPHAQQLRHTAWRHRPAGAVVVSGAPDAPGVPLLADRPLVGGQAAAYVCRGFVCHRPVTNVDELLVGLRGWHPA